MVAGQFDPDKAAQVSSEHFGTLESPDEPIDRTYTVEPDQDGERTVVLRRVGDVQWVGAAYHIPAGSHEEYAAAKVLSYVLGDEPSGRLYKSLVETEKASNVYAFGFGFHDPGLTMSLAEVPENKDIEVARQQLLTTIEQGFSEQPVTEEEVERAVSRF
ncbi:MAG: insulinase family protein [Pirellulaceae bacterium]